MLGQRCLLGEMAGGGALVEKPEHVCRGGQSHNESKRKKSKNPEMFKRKPDDIFKYCKSNYN